jgi:poly-gamma-glutamate capsule biosynthesis protein CapA/YwtB (metallophosphatase superfamily)
MRPIASAAYCAAALACVAALHWARSAETYGPADPIQKDASRFDPRRPLRQEMQMDVPDGFTVGAVGDLIISRPLSQYAPRMGGFDAVLKVLRGVDALYGNLETTIFDSRYFSGSPYSWDGDWTNSSEPAVARDLEAMNFTIVSRANNHSLDWGLEGMRETSRRLDDAGLVYAGVGEERGRARAPRYAETSRARVALVSVASTFRPTTDALPAHDGAPGRPGLSALHVTRTVVLPPAAMRAMVQVDCETHRRHCGESPKELDIFDTKYRVGKSFRYDYEMDPEDLAEIEKNIRSARENADVVIVSIHAHECTEGCDDPNEPRGPGDFLRRFAHEAIDSGADLFVATGNHNLGPVELYRSAQRGVRPILYGLGNFFWSDVQEPLPHDLYQGNRTMLSQAWQDPQKATAYDLTAPLNEASFAHDFTFRSVIAVSRFQGNQLAELRLYPIEDGYGDRLPRSGIPRLVTDRSVSAAIFKQIEDQTRTYGLPALEWRITDNVAALSAAATTR